MLVPMPLETQCIGFVQSEGNAQTLFSPSSVIQTLLEITLLKKKEQGHSLIYKIPYYRISVRETCKRKLGNGDGIVVQVKSIEGEERRWLEEVRARQDRATQRAEKNALRNPARLPWSFLDCFVSSSFPHSPFTNSLFTYPSLTHR
jgi:hypothetical protein